MRDPKEFRERFLRWKNGENYWEQRGINMNTQQSLDLQADLLTPEQLTAIEAALEYYTSGKDPDVPPGTTEKHEQAIMLPEVTVTPNRLSLITYYPGSKEYFTGHSMLHGYGTDPNNGNSISTIIDKRSDDSEYNLVTNNCADATRCALEVVSGKKMNPYFFTTPGDVLDFFKENFDVRESKLNKKRKFKKEYYTNVSLSDLEKIKKLQEELIEKNKIERIPAVHKQAIVRTKYVGFINRHKSRLNRLWNNSTQNYTSGKDAVDDIPPERVGIFDPETTHILSFETGNLVPKRGYIVDNTGT